MSDDERRIEKRLPMEDHIVVTVQYATGEDAAKGTTLYCSTADVSAHGLRVQLERPLDAGCIVNLWVKRTDAPGTVALRGVIKWWKKQIEGDRYWVGIQIDTEPCKDLTIWESMVENL